MIIPKETKSDDNNGNFMYYRLDKYYLFVGDGTKVCIIYGGRSGVNKVLRKSSQYLLDFLIVAKFVILIHEIYPLSIK